MTSFDGKVVIVTGASGGIGAALAKLLTERGATVVPASRSNGCDVMEEASRIQLIESTLARFGRIDCLINNAGRGSYFRVLEAPLDDARSLFELNFFAPLRLAQLAAPHLKATQGTLVNVSSIAGQISLPWMPVYSASKFALASITSTLRMELARAGVNVMGVFPGYVDTPFQANASGGSAPQKVVKGKRFAVSAEACALAIVNGMERRKSTVVTPRSGLLLVWLNRLAPSILEERIGAA